MKQTSVDLLSLASSTAQQRIDPSCVSTKSKQRRLTSSTPVLSVAHSQVFLWTARPYQSICMLGLGLCSFFAHYSTSTSVW